MQGHTRSLKAEHFSTVGTTRTSSVPRSEQGRVHPQRRHPAQHCQGCLHRKASSHLLVSVLILPATPQNLFLDTRTAQPCHPLPSCTCTCSKPCMAITLPPTGCHALGSWPGGWADLGCAGRISLALCHPHGSCRVPPTVCLRFNCPFPEFYSPFSFCLHRLPPFHLLFSKTVLNPLAAVFIMFLQQTHLSKAFGHCNLSSSNGYTWPRASVTQYLLFNWYLICNCPKYSSSLRREISMLMLCLASGLSTQSVCTVCTQNKV